ncbi:ABC transporter substrate-binding protein [Arthrobacter burdickii]|uniref:ABC transporter substrate-binding protein n=1 Tax=Arthrobacter burdickii TaxID=3035920 RepID=A0ABT8JYB8_9MICC|nr:ABC transporter substrate-binding protein [Arthrobacter burdickii]MDN4609808.1 ABC transporter substrate-binding protein [Arthrobacter burdickii]
MPEAVDVGSVLGGRYKVTAYVLASAEKDLVLDGVDQVLNRPVSILVASAGNASQVAASARDLATGDRTGNIQVLDLGISESDTYLVTNRAPAADMLDLIVQQDAPAPEAPYIEPFFTDTLGSEIFGGPRSTEPETYDDHYEEYEEYDDGRQHRASRFAGLARRFGRRGSGDDQRDDTSDVPPAAAEQAPVRQHSHLVPPPPSQRPSGASAASTTSSTTSPGQSDVEPRDESYVQPHVQSRDESRDESHVQPRDESRDESHVQPRDESREHDGTDQGGPAAATGAVIVGAAGAGAAASRHPERAASRFPVSDYDDDDSHSADGPDGYDDDDSKGRNFTRMLVGAVLSIVLVVAVVLAATQLGSLFSGTPVADSETQQATGDPSAEDATTAPTTATAEPTAEAVAPVITGITRVVPDNQALDAANDVNLPLIIDGNTASFWGNQVYASDTFGGLATSLALVVELEQESTISEVSIAQLNGAGGSFSVLINDEPTVEGAEQIAQGGFTAPTMTLPIPEGADGPRTARYVIVDFTQLPRLSSIDAQYPFGLRIAEISVT